MTRLQSSITAATVVLGLARQAYASGPLLGLLLDFVVMVVIVVGVVVGEPVWFVLWGRVQW